MFFVCLHFQSLKTYKSSNEQSSIRISSCLVIDIWIPQRRNRQIFDFCSRMIYMNLFLVPNPGLLYPLFLVPKRNNTISQISTNFIHVLFELIVLLLFQFSSEAVFHGIPIERKFVFNNEISSRHTSKPVTKSIKPPQGKRFFSCGSLSLGGKNGIASRGANNASRFGGKNWVIFT